MKGGVCISRGRARYAAAKGLTRRRLLRVQPSPVPPDYEDDYPGKGDISVKTTNISAISRAQQPSFTITDGRDHIGTVDVIDGIYIVTDINGQVIGRYQNLQAAVRALQSSRGAP